MRFWLPMVASALAVAVVSTTTNPAMADEATAEALFQSGKSLMDQKKYAEACPKFEASYKADPATGTKLNLAECHEKEGKLARAWAEWGEARDQAKRENDTKRVDLAMRRQKELDPRVPKLTIKVSGSVQGLAIYRDELQLESAMLEVPLPVDPGAHVITLRRGSSVLREKKIEIRESASDEVTIDATGIPAASGSDGSSDNAISGPNGPDGKPVMVRKSKGLMAGGIVLACVGGIVTVASPLVLVAEGAGPGLGVFLVGAGMTTGGIIMAVKGGKKVPKQTSRAFDVPPPSVFIGPGSIMVRGQF